MQAIGSRALKPAAGEGGFVLLWAIFGFVLVGGLLAATLSTASSQRRAAGATAKWKTSFYAAEAGLREALDLVSDSLIDGLEPGQSVQLGWRPVTPSTDYLATIHRVDADTGQRLYLLNVISRTAGAFAGHASQNLLFTLEAGPPPAAIAANGPLTVAGKARISGTCSDLVANGALSVSGTLITDGTVSSAATVEVTGAIVDSKGRNVAAAENVDPVYIPPLTAAEHCDEADVVLRNGYVIDPAADDSVSASASSAWAYAPSYDLYTLDATQAAAGTVCAYGSVRVQGDPGTAASPLSLSLISTGAVQISGNPFITPDHSSGLLILAEGDMQLSGTAAASANYAGLLYSGSQCSVGGTPNIQGQLLCRSAPDPAGVPNIVAKNLLRWNQVVTSACAVGGGSQAVPIASRAWSPVF